MNTGTARSLASEGSTKLNSGTNDERRNSFLSARWFAVFFFVSGFCSLVYEVVWLRLAVAQFGVTTPMVSILLSVFMAGLGLGSWGGGVFIRRYQNSTAAMPLRLYALLELLIGASGLLVPLSLRIGYKVLSSAGHNLAWGSASFYFVSGFWVCLSLMPWCACMGATFPFAMAAMGKLQGDAAKHSFSYLYLANVVGAVMGTLIPAFVLIELFGFSETLYFTGALNAALALAVFCFSLSRRLTETRRTFEAHQPSDVNTASQKAHLWQLFSTGLCSMAMEVIWIRQFTVYLGNVVYAFAIILALYLGATFAGSALYRRWIKTHHPRSFGIAWIPLGLFALLPLLSADPRIPIPETVDVFKSLGYGAIRAAFGIVPFSALVGFLTPMLVDRWSGGSPDRAGRAYAVNVLGSILGPLIAGFWIIPLLGERWGLSLIALPLFAIGLLSAADRSQSQAANDKRPLLTFGAAATLSLLLLRVTADYSVKLPRHIELRDHTATVIASGEGMHKRLLVNGTGMTRLTPITKIMAHLPLTFLSRTPKNALVICMGMGTTFRSMLSWGLDATVVELVPSVPKLFGYFHPDAPALLQTSRAHIVVDDGRRYLERSATQYDVIAIDPPPPIGAPTSSLLYSLEFYAAVKPHLRPGGILQVWCPGGDDTTNAAITKAIQQSFPYVRAFTGIDGWGTHYLISMQPIPTTKAADLARRLPAAAARDLVEFNSDSTPDSMLADMLDGEENLADLTKPDPSVQPISDNRAINEYFLLRSIGHPTTY